jgi:8-hydroxy-5-deazaflavin:NADPH oxidoreductase
MYECYNCPIRYLLFLQHGHLFPNRNKAQHGRKAFMDIAIVGSGTMGSGLGKIWAQRGHRVTFSFSRDMQKLEELAGSVPNARADLPSEAVRESSVVLLSVRWGDVRQAIAAAGSLSGKTVIDCTNPLKPDSSALLVGHTTSASEEIAKLAMGAHVVKAFNTAFAEIYHAPSRMFGSRMPTMFYCGNEAEAKKTVAQLIGDAGFEPVDCGPLASARYLEPLAMLLIELAYGRGMGTRIGLSLMRR